MTTKVSSLHYVAPEIITSSDGYTEKVDCWSFGILLFAMLSGAPPFNADNEMDVLGLVKEGKFEFAPAATWDPISAEAKDLVSKCLVVDAANRIDFLQIMDHGAMQKAESDGAVYSASEKLGRAGGQDDRPKTFAIVKILFSLLAELLSDDQVEQLRTVFRNLDNDDSGMIEIEEALDGIKALVEEAIAETNEQNQQPELLKLLSDGSLSGRVNYLMYICTLTDRRRQMRKEAAQAVFAQFDIDKNGHISLYEIAQALAEHENISLSKLGKNVSVREVQKIWREMGVVFCLSPGQHLPNRELTFDQFFKRLPSSKKYIGL
jgi:calcium-dependent protein kinase